MNNSNIKTFLAISLSLIIFFVGKFILTNYKNISLTMPDFSHLISFNFFKTNQPTTNFTNQNNSLTLSTTQVAPPTAAPTTYKPKNQPTYKPAPTTPIKNVKKTPTVVPTKAPIGDVRPGSTLAEMAQIAQDLTCTPAALLLSIKTIESGQSFFSADAATIEKYNTYNWWNNVSSAKEICAGYGYETISGLIPSDSQYAGLRCQVALGAQSYTGKPMGIIQLSDFEASAYQERAASDANITTSLDRRVLFDAILLAGYHFKNISLERDDNCSNWDLKYIAKVACKYAGQCKYQYTVGSNESGDYCYRACEYYNQYSGSSYDCSNAANLVDASCNFQ